MIARFAGCQAGIDSASVLGLVCLFENECENPLHPVLAAQIFARCPKESREVTDPPQCLTTESDRTSLFYRANSFRYSAPPVEQTDDLPDTVLVTHWGSSSRSSTLMFRFDRHPRVLAGFSSRIVGGEAVPPGRPGSGAFDWRHRVGEFSLAVVNDRRELSHRVFRGVFAEAQAVAIFGDRAMFMLPDHGNSFRLFQADAGEFQANYIRQVIGLFQAEISVSRPECHSVVTLLRRYLSYRSPQW